MENCIFCKIANGEIPSTRICEDEYFIAILDISPSALGHMLVLPKKHSENIYTLDNETASALMPFVKRMAVALKEALSFEGMNILQNNGEVAGQTVMHYHMHIIPRYESDKVKIDWEKLSPTKEEFDELVSKLRNLL